MVIILYIIADYQRGNRFSLVPKGFNTQEPAHPFAGELQGEVVDSGLAVWRGMGEKSMLNPWRISVLTF
jgi:hypothetical protein